MPLGETMMARYGLLQGKVVAVTGAGRGIGREIALLCASEWASVIVNDLGASADGQGADQGPAEEVARLIRQGGGHAIANGANVADPAQAATIIEDAIKHFGRIDGVVNNAGILRDSIFHRLSHEDWKVVIDVCLNGPFNVAKAAAPYFKEQQSGSFVHFASASGVIGNMGQANYAAAKMGVVGLSNSIALDMERFNVRSNCIVPFAWSRLTGTIPVTSEEERKRVERMQAMTPAKIAPLVAALLSDSAADITGQIFGARKNEVMLFSKIRPSRQIAKMEGWTPRTIASEAFPAMRAAMQPLARSADVWPYDPI